MSNASEILRKADAFLHDSIGAPINTKPGWLAYCTVLDLRNRIEYEKLRVTHSRLFADFVINLFSFSKKRKSSEREKRFEYNKELINKSLEVRSMPSDDVAFKKKSDDLITELCSFLERQTIKVEMIDGQLYLVTVFSNRRSLTTYEEIMYLFFDIVPREW